MQSARSSLPLVALAVLGLLGGLYFAARRPVLPIDDATIYVMGAESLALGHGYRLLGYPAEPPNTFYPPGYSLALAPLFKLQPEFPANLSLLQLANLLAFYALLGLGALVLRRCYRASAADTVLALLLVATTPLALLLSTAVMGDTLFGVFALGAILLVRAGWDRRGPQGVGLLVAGGLLAALAYYTRSAGIALVIALAIRALLQARRAAPWRLALLLLPGLSILPWLVWTSLNGGSGYVRHWIHSAPGWSIGVSSPEDLLVVALGNFLLGSEILWAVAPALVHDEVVPGVAAAQPVAWLAASALFAFALWQSWRAWRRDGELVHLYLLLYLLATLLWPYRVLGRFLWPVAPLLAWYLVVGLREVWSRVSTRFGARRLPVDRLAVGLLLVANGFWLVGAAAQVAATGWAGDLAYREEMLAMRRVADYLRGLEPPRAALGTNHLSTASWWYLYTGRRGVDAVARADGAEPFFVRRALQGDPDEIAYFVYQRPNGTPTGGAEDLPVVLATLAARGAATEPLYCTDSDSLCVYNWRPRPVAP